MDVPSIIFSLFIVLLLVLANAFFVAAEFAMVKVRESKIEAMILSGNSKAKLAQVLVKDLNAYLSACQLGITLASLGLGWVGEPAVAKFLYPLLTDITPELAKTISFTIAFSLITALHIILGELVPKTISIQEAEKVCLWVAFPLILFYKVMYPAIWLLNSLANKILSMLGFKVSDEHESPHTEEEIRMLMEESHKSGLIDNTELMLVDNIFDFTDKTAKEIMIPRTDMICLYTQNSFRKNLEIALAEQNTRYPLCEIDKDNIIGFIHIKDLVNIIVQGGEENLSKITRPILSVPETMSIASLLKLLQKNKAQMALLIDEYGGTAGIVTVEDILEELVGEIQDEFDEERPEIEKIENGYSISGLVLVEDVNDLLHINLDFEMADTMGGWFYNNAGSKPEVNQFIEQEGYTFTAQEVDNIRITRIKIEKTPNNDEEDS